jgi:BASS family bile acid:Na+ symporter
MLQTLLGLTLIVFMVGNLLAMGLKTNLQDAVHALHDARFVVFSAIWCFVLSPAVAVLLTRIIPLAEPYAIGLLFLGLAPCAPFLPAVAARAGGDLAQVAAFMLLAAVGTVAIMPLMVPVLVKGFAADPWTIARPLLLYIALPLAVGLAVQRSSKSLADRADPYVKWVTSIDTLAMLVLIIAIYGNDFIGMVGSYAIGTLILFCSMLSVASYVGGIGLSHSQRSVLALGLGTRNIGAAIAPLFAAPGTDRRAIVMCAMAVPVTVGFSIILSRVLTRRAGVTEEGASVDQRQPAKGPSEFP